jgi:aryl-alcohol dehydrogenase-like predicted oxidoreductase
MSQSYGAGDDQESIRTILAALAAGFGMLDTSDVYGAGGAKPGVPLRGFGHNESLIGQAIKGRRSEVVIATKFGITLTPDGTNAINASPEYARTACNESLRRLGVDYVDLFYCHRLDRRTPVEDTVGAMSELVAAGKVRAIGLSETSAKVLRRAHAVHPVSALQSEYSLWERSAEVEMLPTCRELGITFVPFSPLGRALLTGELPADATFNSADLRSSLPRFNPENLESNVNLVEGLRAFSADRGLTPGQVALAWLLLQPFDVVPIPGTKREKHLKENLVATSVALSADDLAELSAMFSPDLVRGARY